MSTRNLNPGSMIYGCKIESYSRCFMLNASIEIVGLVVGWSSEIALLGALVKTVLQSIRAVRLEPCPHHLAIM